MEELLLFYFPECINMLSVLSPASSMIYHRTNC